MNESAPESRPSSGPDRRRILENAPPSAGLIYKTLRHEGPYRYSDLQAACWLADSTAHEAVSWLLDHGLIEKQRDLTDLRTTRYALATQE